jgi:putative acetyltransferase
MARPAAVRRTEPPDRPAVLDVVRAAFTDDTRTGDEEVDIVITTWRLGDSVRPIDLVALDEETIAGHVLAARGTFGDHEALAVAPLAVAPGHHGRGIGSMLMRELLDRANQAGWPLAVLLGRPEFYSRFGFEPASHLGISYAPAGRGNPHFQALRLRPFTHTASGTFRYCWERH